MMIASRFPSRAVYVKVCVPGEAQRESVNLSILLAQNGKTDLRAHAHAHTTRTRTECPARN